MTGPTPKAWARLGFTTTDAIATHRKRSRGATKRTEPKTHSRVDQERGQPDKEQQRDEKAVRLELERQVASHRVPAHGDEEDDQDELRQEIAPREHAAVRDYGGRRRELREEL